MNDWTIYHNPKCSKSRAALALLTSRGITPRVVEYLTTPPDETTLRRLIARLAVPVRELVRTSESPFEELALDLEDESAVIAALCRHPVLLQRPIVERGDRAVIGRPPENVLKLF